MKGYRPMPMEPDGAMYARRIARKEHPCTTKKGCTIKPGEAYVDYVIAPWTMIVDDVNDDGQPTGDLSGKWERFRYHERHESDRVDFDKSPVIRAIRERNPNAYPESQRRGGGDPLMDYLWAKGEL